MTEFKGRHFGFLLMLCSGWVLARTAMNWPADNAQTPLMPASKALPSPASISAKVSGEHISDTASTPNLFARRHPLLVGARVYPVHYPAGYFERRSEAMPIFADSSFPIPGRDPPAIPLLERPVVRNKLDVDAYAYSFWRGGGRGSGLATAGQYGGGQTGLIATIGIRDGSGHRMPFAILVRSSVAHDNLQDRELALGVRWQPSASLPVSISAERRFRGMGTDNFALYAAGGRSDMRLPAGFKLDVFAQAGFVSGQNGGHFFDAQAKAERRILPTSPLPLYFGAGAWSGGQKGIARLDIGPSLRTELPLRHTRVRISADWRFRIAGDASPGNGPALTLSTGF